MEQKQGKLISFVARKGALVLGATALVLMLRLLKNILVSRILAPELRGIWGLLSVAPTFLVSAGNLGLGSAITYYSGKKLYDARHTLGAAFWSTLVCGGALGLAAWHLVGAGYFFEGNTDRIDPYRILILAVTPFFWLQVMVRGYFTGVAQVERLTVVRILESALPLLLFLVFYFCLSMDRMDAATYSWFWGFVAAGACAVALLPLRQAFPPLLPAKACRDFLSFGLRGHMGNFFNLIVLRIDIVFISWFLTPADLGQYMIATSVAELLMLLPEAFLVPFTGALFGAEEKDSAAFSRNVLRMVFWGMLCVCLVTMLLARPLIHLLFGSAYLPAWGCTLALIPGMLFLAVFYVLKVDMNNRGRPGITSMTACAAAVLNVGLNWLCIPRYGIEAAAVASSCSYMVCALLMLGMYARLHGISLCAVLAVNRAERGAVLANVGARLQALRSGKEG